MPLRLPKYPFRLHTAPALSDGLIVSEFTGTEAISAPYAFDVLAVWEGPVALTDLPALGQPATLALADSDIESGPPRMIHGVLDRVKLDGLDYERGSNWLRVRLVPKLALLRHSRRRRVFQELTVVQIVDSVLSAHDVPHRWAADAPTQPIGYAVQYDESDHAFVHRLLARAGLLYYFEHPHAEPGSGDAREMMVICDRANQYGAIARGGSTEPLGVKLADREGTYKPTETLQSFSFERRSAPTGTRHRDWEMRTPGVFRDAELASDVDPGLGTLLVIDDYEQRNASDRIRVTPNDTRVSLEQARNNSVRAAGESDCHLFTPGHRFIVDNHDIAHLNTQWVLTRVEHVGNVPELSRDPIVRGAPRPAVYENKFRCAPATLTIRPARPARRRPEVSESAVVVGPPGEEIYVDLFGRVKVQFLWDREGRPGERSSCWVRVAQTWAGSGWGFQFVPRIGMEVLVTFVGGDADHPVVTGCLYNALQAPTHVLPDAKSRSGIRTRSTPGGAAWNEISFEDAAGEEQMLIHAGRDQLETIAHDARRVVGNDETIAVTANRHDTVSRDESRGIGGERTASVGGNDALTVTGDRFETVRGNRTVTVTRDQTLHVEGSRFEAVTGHVDQRVTHDRSARVEGHDRVDAHRATTTVHTDRVDRVEGAYTIAVGKHDAKRSLAAHVEGRARISATDAIELRSTTAITFKCGDSVIKMKPDGIEMLATKFRFHIDGATLLLKEQKIDLAADTAVLAKSEKVALKSSGASVELTGDAKIDGDKVKLKASADVDDLEDETVEPTTIELVDKDGNPLPGQRYVIVMGDGSEHEGVLDGDGKATVSLDEAAQIEFPDLTEVESA